MSYLSEGWPSRYNPNTLARRADSRYVEHMGRYTLTSSQLGRIRSKLIELADDAEIQPPITRHDIRLGTRDDVIRQKIGLTGVELLAAHEDAVAANVQAMASLRGEANRLSHSKLLNR